MCGFVAIVGPEAIAPGVVEAGVSAIAHRGPDGRATWRSSDGSAALGHVRLAIQDLSKAGAQPMVSADGVGIIAYNGEVYNAAELASRLDCRLRSRSDTEVVLELLRRHGTGALRLLRGMFAFAYWDGEALLLVRDRMGVKPLFYAKDGERLIAASEIGAILAVRRGSPEIDGRAIDDYLTYLYVPPPRTGIIGVRELPPGHWLRWRPGADPVIERYWSVPSHASRGNAHPERIHELLEDSVRAHLVSDVPVGVFLSGGLDSSSIVALASKHYPGTLKTFSVTFGDEGNYLDERRFAGDVSSRFGTDHREIHVNADVATILPEMVARFGQPFGNPTAVLTYALSRATREHVKVALAGDGGDELLGGYPRYRGVWLAKMVQRLPSSPRTALQQAVGRWVPEHAARGLPADRLRRFLDHAQRPIDEMYFRWVSYLDDETKERMLAHRREAIAADPPTEPYEFFARLRRRHATLPMQDAASLVDLESFLPCNVLAYGDRMSMAHSLEVRVPFCDHILAEELAPLPLSVKAPGGIQKGLFRWAMRKDLPASVLVHRKVGFNPPIAAWLRGGLAPLVEEYLSESSVRRRGLFSWGAVARLLEGFRAGGMEAAHAVWAIVVAEAWLRQLREVRPISVAAPSVGGSFHGVCKLEP